MQRSSSNERLVYGVGPVEEILGAKPKAVHEIWFLQSSGKPEAGHRKIVQEAEKMRLIVRHQGKEVFEKKCLGGNHQGVLALCEPFEYVDWRDVLPAGEKNTPPLLVALDGITDPHNFGAIIRSAHLFGANGVIIAKDRACMVTAVVSKTSAGAVDRLPIAMVTNLARALEEMKQDGIWIAAAVAEERALPLWQLDAAIPLCLVIGAEGEGIRPLVRKQADYAVEIPLQGTGVGSLNASVAAGVLLYETARQRANPIATRA